MFNFIKYLIDMSWCYEYDLNCNSNNVYIKKLSNQSYFKKYTNITQDQRELSFGEVLLNDDVILEDNVFINDHFTNKFINNPKKYLNSNIPLLKNLEECEGWCSVERKKFPQHRENVENYIIQQALKFKNNDKLIIVDFGCGALFQTCVILQKLCNLKRWKSIDIHLIDPIFSSVLYDHDDQTNKIKDRLASLKLWFEYQKLNININIYPHMIEYYYRCLNDLKDNHIDNRPDLILGIDYIDEIGLLNGVNIYFMLLILLTFKENTKSIVLNSLCENKKIYKVKVNKNFKDITHYLGNICNENKINMWHLDTPFDKLNLIQNLIKENTIIKYI